MKRLIFVAALYSVSTIAGSRLLADPPDEPLKTPQEVSKFINSYFKGEDGIWKKNGVSTSKAATNYEFCRRVYLDGSFVTAKRAPGDFDVCWDVTGVDPALLDPVLLTFDRGRAAQKSKYRGELFPAQLPNGITGLTFLEFFQIDKQTGKPKGIVVIDLGEWPP